MTKMGDREPLTAGEWLDLVGKHTSTDEDAGSWAKPHTKSEPADPQPASLIRSKGEEWCPAELGVFSIRVIGCLAVINNRTPLEEERVDCRPRADVSVSLG
jgi:hypothetical protein